MKLELLLACLVCVFAAVYLKWVKLIMKQTFPMGKTDPGDRNRGCRVYWRFRDEIGIRPVDPIKCIERKKTCVNILNFRNLWNFVCVCVFLFLSRKFVEESKRGIIITCEKRISTLKLKQVEDCLRRSCKVKRLCGREKDLSCLFAVCFPCPVCRRLQDCVISLSVYLCLSESSSEREVGRNQE